MKLKLSCQIWLILWDFGQWRICVCLFIGKHSGSICFWVKEEQWTDSAQADFVWSFVEEIEKEFSYWIGNWTLKTQGFLLISRFCNCMEILIRKERLKYIKVGLFKKSISFWDYSVEHWFTKASKERAYISARQWSLPIN